MKMVIAILLVAVCAGTGCSNRGRDSVFAQSKQQRKEWQFQMEQRLKKIDREMDDLVEKANTDPNVSRMKQANRYYDRMAELQKQRTDTRQKYESLRKAPDAKWEETKGEVERAADGMEASWRKFLEELRS